MGRIRWSNDLIDAWLLQNQPSIYREGEFSNVGAPISLRCAVCNHRWRTAWQHLYSKGTRCPSCVTKNNALRSRLTVEEVDNRIPQELQRLTHFERTSDIVTWKCNKCNNEWNTSVTSVIHQKSGCPACANVIRSRLTNEIVDAFINEHRLPIRRLGEVYNNKHKIMWECTKCNYQWLTSPSKIKNQRTLCPKCANKIPLSNHDVE